MREICGDVQPTLLPINENDFERKLNTADNARLDISARGLWNGCEKIFFDIRVTSDHPTSQSDSVKSLAHIYKHGKEKDECNQRVIDIKKSSFNSLVFTSGGMATECTRVNKRLAEKIAKKYRELYGCIYMHLS